MAKKSNYLISVIIPAHNEEEYIGETLRFMKDQNYKKYEIIVVCDNCTDNTAKVARKYKAKVINVKFGRVSKVRNAGAKKAKGSILVFNDADTIASPNYLSEVKKAIDEGYVTGSAKMKPETKHILTKLATISWNHFSKRKSFAHGNTFIRKDIFDKIGGYDERLAVSEDTNLSERLQKKGKFKFLKNAYIVASERKFKEKGYLREFWDQFYDGAWYLIARKHYYKHHLLDK